MISKEVTAAVEKAVFSIIPNTSQLMAPQEGVTHTGEIKKGWTSYRDIAIKICNQRTSLLSDKEAADCYVPDTAELLAVLRQSGGLNLTRRFFTGSGIFYMYH